MKIRKSTTIVSIFTMFAFFGLLSACNNSTTPGETDPDAVTGVTLDSSSISIPINGTATLTATVEPETATNKNVTWSSSDTSKATVTNGVVTAVAVGTATITVTTVDGGKTASCNVTVTPLPASIAVTNPPTKTLYAVGETLDLTGLVVTASYDGDYPDNVITVNISNISGFDPTTPGEQELTITYGGKTAKFMVTVIVPITDLTGVPTLAAVDTPLVLSGIVTPDNASLADITWTVKSGTATISGSTLTASAAGTVVITAAFINNRDDDFTKDFTITANVYPAGTVIVSNNADTGAGSLRQALTNVPTGGSRTIVIDPVVKTIALASRLPTINRDITIEGNGVTLTPGTGWIEDANSQMMYFTSGGTVTISRVWFKDGRATSNGAAINVLNGNLTLESCIFSGNRTSGSSGYGGAIYNGLGTVNVKACTFYGNSAGYTGGAIYSQSTITLTGNLFYGNTAVNSRPVVYVLSTGTVTSNGYNAVDVTMGTANTESGWTADPTDKQITSQPISPTSFRLLTGSDAAGVITSLPAEYPAFDFYGEAISAPAAVGAVQSTASGNGYALALSVNVNGRGSVGITPEANADGLYSGAVAITATPADGFILGYWLKDGVNAGSANPLSLTITAHTAVQAVFAQVFTVNSDSDATGSATTAGTLRHAMTNAQDGDIISLSGVTSIALASRLPNITKAITIEGNGVTLTPGAGWTESSTSQMMNIANGGTVTISRVWFKDGRASSGGAITNSTNGNLTLESCIFSGNQAGTYFGGAIDNSGTLNLKGCTFYGNSAGSYGGAVYNGGTLTLTGNLFYGNTAGSSGPAVYVSFSGNAVTSNGYNAVDVALGTTSAQSGWTADTTDKQITSQPVSPVSFKLLTGSGAANVMSTLPSEYPASDFYGVAISAPAAAGAVQSTASGGGYALNLSVNNSANGSVTVTPDPNSEGLYSGTVTITANPANNCNFAYWLKDGTNAGSTNPLTFTITAHTVVQAVFTKVFIVDSASDTSSTTTVGTLRHAVTNALDGDIIRIASGVTSIELVSRLPSISKNIIIEGNGVTLTPGSGWTEGNTSQLMSISGGTVTISRIWFKDGRASGSGAAINNSGNLTLESCIFSGNQVSTSSGSGGALYNNSSGILNVKGCTFYENTAGSYGGAILNMMGTLTLTGNLFYGNTATSGSPVVNNTFTETTSLGYNVVNAASGTGTTQCGWTFITGDKQISSQPVSAVSFRLLSGSDAAGVMSALPSGYPAFDFYGDPVTAPAAAGAVQSSGYELTLSVNNSTQGSVSVTSAQPADGLYSTVTITAASAGYALSRWQIDGVESGNTNPLTITLTANTNVQAVFGRLLIVDNFSDASGSETTAGTLRYALTDMEDFDVIRLSGVTPGETVIELTSQLDIRTGITIEGNGVTLTQGSEWTGSSSMMYVGTVSVAISRVWFKDGRATSTYSSAGLETNGNQLTLESCIFSGNQASGTYGGAIYNGGKLNVKGCTFYGNSSRSGGAIYFFNNSASSTLTLTGSLFYENTASEEYPVVRPSATVPVTSTGYNVVDVALGTGTDQCGWASGVTGDQYRAASPFTSAETLAPVSGLRSVIPQTFAANMPATDFYGEMRTYPSAPGAVK